MSYKDLLENIDLLARRTVAKCTENKIKIATAESCTGGMISSAITAVSGSSAVIELGICSYSNRIKSEALGVSASTLARFSEYSIQCAQEMALGAMRLGGADFAVSTTGVAGPTGASEEAPVGTVFFGVCARDGVSSFKRRFDAPQGCGCSEREYIRTAAVLEALTLLNEMIDRRILKG